MQNFQSILVKIFLIAVGIPTLLFILGVLLQLTIPGCTCSGLGTNCTSCWNMDHLIYVLTFSGGGLAMMVMIIGIPIMFILGIIFELISFLSRFTNSTSSNLSLKSSDTEEIDSSNHAKS